ncbi:PREDICTED: pre-mRNA-splicing factor CWC25 homolog isoform X1 [Trachymyrmex cornetzi]|uniref:pre-mRNA-splicing factor CWC25 homolog isoform X1 n=1 Tax=Trachymyrmex cornetzi TaxID=471704 RepID=UPI00084F3E72|nr:PREDICTED: pre-mRNA-splicing factor CWC25 homolog isoform X1 [Trachymyrmex cornetzi]
MGGGDLVSNLKKSWHPSTMKNIEKVRKAEQQNDQENRRIAELKKEIEMEKDLEDIKKYAVEQGVIEKKDDMKLDWMYKGPNQMVNREEYLLGRPVDKAFEQMQQAEKDSEMNRMPKNHVEYECIPPSLRFFSGNEQVDLARKIQEDPLYSIKKKEMETRNQLLKNPVKLKQLKELLEQSSKNKSEKKKKRLKQSDSSEDEAKLDVLLATKYKQLKDISEKYLLKSMKKIKHKRTKKSKKHHDSDSETDSSNDDTSIKKRRHKQKKQKKSRSDSDDNTDSNSKNIAKRETECDRKYSRNDTKLDDTKKQDRKRKLSEDRNSKYERSQKYGEEDNKNKRQRYDSKQRDDSRNKYNDKRRYSMEKETTISNSGRTSTIKSTSNTNHIKFKDRKEEKYRPKTRPSLTEEEKEQRRKEMMANAVWRDKEREKNVKMYREQEKREEQNITLNNKDFIRKQLVVATEVGTVASRIKANINNIQRSGRAMDTNFAKR